MCIQNYFITLRRQILRTRLNQSFFSFRCIGSNFQSRNILHIFDSLPTIEIEISIDGKTTNQLSFSIFTLTPSGYDTYTYDTYICICLLDHHCLLSLYVCSPYCVPTPIIYTYTYIYMVYGTFFDFVSFAKTNRAFPNGKKLWKKKKFI